MRGVHQIFMRTLFLVVSGLIALSFAAIQESQNSTRYENLVFEGAGIRGIAYAGVIEELEKQGLIDHIERIGGTSAGAITALMVSLGYTSSEIAAIISNTRFERFNDGKYFFVGGLSRLKSRYGWYRANKFEAWLENIIETKTGNAHITFAHLSALGYKDLYVTATCLNKQKLIIFSSDSYPDMKVKDAVRISMSIPLYFEAVYIDSLGTVYDQPVKNIGLDLVVDGGIIGNYPVFMFDSVIIDSNKNRSRIANPKTLGVRIDSDRQIESDTTSGELASIEVNNMNDYMEAFYTLLLESTNRNALLPEDWDRTISVSDKGIRPKVKRMSMEEKELLINSGRESTAKFLGKK